MSKYVEYDCQDLRNQEMLLAALAALGWSAGKVEVHAEPQSLFGYEGRQRKEKAHVIIRRNNTGVGASNDIGFLRNDKGTYTPIVSEYDGMAVKPGGVPFVEAVTNAYSEIVADKAVSTVVNKTIPRMKAQGIIPRHATFKTLKEGKTTRVVLTY